MESVIVSNIRYQDFSHHPSQNHETANAMHDTTRRWNQHHKATQDTFHCTHLPPVESHPLPVLLPFIFNPWFSSPSSGFKQDPPPDPKPRTSLHLSLPPPDGKSARSLSLSCLFPLPLLTSNHHHHLSGMISGFCDVVVRYCGNCRVSWGASSSIYRACCGLAVLALQTHDCVVMHVLFFYVFLCCGFECKSATSGIIM